MSCRRACSVLAVTAQASAPVPENTNIVGVIMTTSGIMAKTTSPPRSWEPGRPVTVWLEPARCTVSRMTSLNLDLVSDEGNIVFPFLTKVNLIIYEFSSRNSIYPFTIF